MKFKNYKNSHTNEDTIYSRKNIADMSVREAFSRKDEIMAQHNSIGIPSEGELQSSPNAVWVESYTRDDGTEVRGHWRSKPEGSSDESSTNNNSQKEDITTDEQGSVTGGASDVNNKIGNINIKDNYKTSPIQDGLMNYNNEQNAKYPDARDCMNIAIIGPDNLKDNQKYKLLSGEDVKNINSKLGINLSDNLQTVEFSEESSLANSLNNSQELKQQLKDNLNKIENGDNLQVSFNKDENLFRSLHNATVFDCKIEKGTLTGYIYDKYDFDYQSYNLQHGKLGVAASISDAFMYSNPFYAINEVKNGAIKNNFTDFVNDSATFLQNKNIIKNYNIIVPIKMKL